MQTAFFLDGRSGRLFCTGTLRRPNSQNRKFLVLPPFGEEMNKSRHVLSALTRSLGGAGHDVLLMDFFGTGDSGGDFRNASIDVWRGDIDDAISYLAGREPVNLVGLRSGALLAGDAAGRHSVESLTLIHPIADGRQQLNQLLRLRLAGNLMGNGKKESAADLRKELADGNAIEIAGYRLSPDMADGLERLMLADTRLDGIGQVNWIELIAEHERPLMPVSRRIIDKWERDGFPVTAKTVVCDSFWATQEIAQCPGVVDVVMAVLSD